MRAALAVVARPLVGLATAAAGLVLLAAPASAHGAGTTTVDGGIDRRAIAVGLAFAAVVASAAALAGRTTGRGRSLDGGARVLAPVAAALAPAAGLGAVATTAVAGLAVVVALAPARSTARGVTSSALLAVVAAGGGGGGDLVERCIGGGHVVAAAWWSGVVLAVAIAWRQGSADGRRRAKALALPAIALVGVVAATGALATAEHLGDAALALGSWWGRVLAAKVALVAAVAVAAAALRTSWVPRLESSVLTGAALTGLVLAAAGGPLSGAAPTGPLVLGLAAGDAVPASVGDGPAATEHRSLVVVTPLTPGPNTILVQGEAADVVVDGRAVPLDRRADGLRTATVGLPAGRHTIRVGPIRRAVTVRVDEGAEVVRATLPAGPTLDADCLDRLAGAAAAAATLTDAGRATRLEVVDGSTCAVDGAPVPSWAAATAAALDALAARGSTGPPLVVAEAGDDRAAEVVAGLAGATVVAPGDALASLAPSGAAPATGPVVVATGAATAAELVPALVAATGGTRPLVLAPWLLDAGVLAELVQHAASSVLVAAHRDPTSQLAVDYRSALLDGGIGAPATAAGLEGYVAAVAAAAGVRPAEATPGVFGTSSVAILPAELAHPSESGWTPGVALVRVA